MAQKKDNSLIIITILIAGAVIIFQGTNIGRQATLVPNDLFGYGLNLGQGTYGTTCGWSPDSLNYHVGSNMVITLPSGISYTFTPRLYCPFDYCKNCNTWCSAHCSWVQNSCGSGISQIVEHLIVTSSGKQYVVGQANRNIGYSPADCQSSCSGVGNELRDLPFPSETTEGDNYLASLRSQGYSILSDAYQTKLGRTMPSDYLNIIEGGLNITITHGGTYTYSSAVPCQSVQLKVVPDIKFTSLTNNVNGNLANTQLTFTNNYKATNISIDTSMTINTLLGTSQVLTSTETFEIPLGQSTKTISYNPADPGTYNINIQATATIPISFYSQTITQTNIIGEKNTALTIKANCPYECCNQENYQTKNCAQTGYTCQNNLCKAPAQCNTNADCPQNTCFGQTCNSGICLQNTGTAQQPACPDGTITWKDYPNCTYECKREITLECSNNNDCTIKTPTENDCTMFYKPRNITTQGTCNLGRCSFNNAATVCTDWQIMLQDYKWILLGAIALFIFLVLRLRNR